MGQSLPQQVAAAVQSPLDRGGGNVKVRRDLAHGPLLEVVQPKDRLVFRRKLRQRRSDGAPLAGPHQHFAGFQALLAPRGMEQVL